VIEHPFEPWWTGKAPDQCPGYDSSGRLRALAQLEFRAITRQDVLDYFDNGWTLTELLFSALESEEAFCLSPTHGLRHPLIFYYGHPAVLYVNKLRVAGLLEGPVDARLEGLLEVGVDEMSWDDMSKNSMKWPRVTEIRDYRQRVYSLIKELILTDGRLDPQKVAFSSQTPAWALVMGFEHERIHLETSSVLIREMPLKFLRRPEAWPHLDDKAFAPPAGEFVTFEGAEVRLGKPEDYPSFGWDNEYGLREMTVPAFQMGRHLISNAQFLDFVDDGGYRESRFWSKEGWAWRSFRNTKAPSFWVPEGPGGLHRYKIRTIFEVVDFRADWPAVVNFHEAEAYCAWRSERDPGPVPYRLASEAEWHRLQSGVAKNAKWNHSLVCGSESSVYSHSSEGVFDVFGNVWQWCADHFNPLPGFRMHPYYEDFSVPCFDGKHHLILGGSFASSGDEASVFARFHFRPHFVQHAGFRIARSVSERSPSTAVRLDSYESLELLSQYLLLHFGTASESLLSSDGAPFSALDFPQRCADRIAQVAERLGVPMNSALDIGCAVGGSSFRLSEFYERVVGVDLSARFVATASILRDGGQVEYLRKDQGDISSKLFASRPPGARASRIQFMQADACRLPVELKNFDAVLMANLLCRLPDPRASLESMGGERSVVSPGGLLALVSPYSWLEQHTSRDSWLGGKLLEGHPVSSAEEIKKILGREFELVEEDNLPLLIREHERKYQYIVSHLMIWQRKSA
jgi:5-histidylcysteine sulfoxide synthase/putative 4-mercaptohistidine N1-methyltranferase